MPVSDHPSFTTNLSSLHHHLLHPRRLGEIILGNQQVALLRDLR
jgi:hypothetical protein